MEFLVISVLRFIGFVLVKRMISKGCFVYGTEIALKNPPKLIPPLSKLANIGFDSSEYLFVFIKKSLGKEAEKRMLPTQPSDVP